MSFDFSTNSGVQQYLDLKHSELCASIAAWTGRPIDVTMLSGGLANFVYRVKFQDDGTVIIKQYPPYAAGIPSFQLSDKRYFSELQGLRLGQRICNDYVRTPQVLYSDDENRVIFMTDIGCNATSARDILQKHGVDCEDVLRVKLLELSKHVISALPRLAEQSTDVSPGDAVYRNDAAREALPNVYNAVADGKNKLFASVFGSDLWLNKWKAHSYFSSSVPEHAVLVFGDFHPNSVFLDQSQEFLWLLDWEFARFDECHWDVTQWAGNLWVMAQNPNGFHEKETRELLALTLACWKKSHPKGHFSSDEVDQMEGRFVSHVLRLLPFSHWGIPESSYEVVCGNLLNEVDPLFNVFRQ